MGGSEADQLYVAFDDTLVRSVCPDCGTVELPATQVTVLLTYDGTPPRYRYTCPSCAQLVEKLTSQRAVSMLHGVGAHMVFVPAAQQSPVRDESFHADSRPTAAAITTREIRAFRRALDQVGDIAAAAGGTQLS